MDTHTRLHEHLSALLDGELAPSELELAFAALDTESGRQAWQAYHCIGEVLRAAPCVDVSDMADGSGAHFGARLASRLAQEDAAGTVLALNQPEAGLPLDGPLVQR